MALLLWEGPSTQRNSLAPYPRGIKNNSTFCWHYAKTNKKTLIHNSKQQGSHPWSLLSCPPSLKLLRRLPFFLLTCLFATKGVLLDTRPQQLFAALTPPSLCKSTQPAGLLFTFLFLFSLVCPLLSFSTPKGSPEGKNLSPDGHKRRGGQTVNSPLATSMCQLHISNVISLMTLSQVGFTLPLEQPFPVQHTVDALRWGAGAESPAPAALRCWVSHFTSAFHFLCRVYKLWFGGDPAV